MYKSSRTFRFAVLAALASLLAALPIQESMAQEQNASTPAAAPAASAQRSQADLEKLVAPIALYPDPLLATVLPASAYPLEIVQAARLVKGTNDFSKIDAQPWDQNVKSLARFPEALAKLNDDIGWTSDLGQAFVDQQKDVMDAIQVMRNKAAQAGTLKTSPQQVIVVTNTIVETKVEEKVVVVTNTIVQIQPAQPEVIYVPQYSPTAVYAPPPPGATLLSFGVGMAMGAVIANNCNWHSGGVYYHGDVDIDVNRNVNVNQNVNVNRNANANRSATAGGQRWQPDTSRRPSTSASSTQARGWSSPSASSASATPAAANRASASTQRPASTQSARSNVGSPAAASTHSAFSGPGGGAQTRQASARGSTSRAGIQGGGGRGRR